VDSRVSLFLNRADNELLAARTLYRISIDEQRKIAFQLPSRITFYSSVISRAYYSIFYCTQAYLQSKRISISSKQGQHQQVYSAFKRLVMGGIVSKDLLVLYDSVRIKAELLLSIFHNERRKRSQFTYETLPEANRSPAEESLRQAFLFVSPLKQLLRY